MCLPLTIILCPIKITVQADVDSKEDELCIDSMTSELATAQTNIASTATLSKDLVVACDPSKLACHIKKLHTCLSPSETLLEPLCMVYSLMFVHSTLSPLTRSSRPIYLLSYLLLSSLISSSSGAPSLLLPSPLYHLPLSSYPL